MKIFCKVEVFYKEPATKIHKERWESIYDSSDCITFVNQGYELKSVISICTEDGHGRHEILKSYDFVPTDRPTRRNISFLDNTFQYDEKYDEIVCLNKYINI